MSIAGVDQSVRERDVASDRIAPIGSQCIETMAISPGRLQSASTCAATSSATSRCAGSQDQPRTPGAAGGQIRDALDSAATEPTITRRSRQ